jgi:predicted ester cyclase
MFSSDQDKEIVRRVFEAFDAVDVDTLNELMSPHFVAHSLPPGFSQGQRGFLELASQWAAGLSDIDTTLDDLLAAEDGKVVARITTRATHTGEVFGVQPSNRKLTFTAIEIYAVADGKVTEWWAEINLNDLFQQPEDDTSTLQPEG